MAFEVRVWDDHSRSQNTLRRQRPSRGTVEADKSALALRYAHSHSHASVPCPLSSIAWSLARFRGLAILAVSGSRRGIAEIRPALPPHHQPDNNCHENCVQKRRPASRIKKAHARQIVARTVEAGDESELDRVTTVGKDDRRRRSRRLGRERRDGAAGRKDHGRLSTNEIGR